MNNHSAADPAPGSTHLAILRTLVEQVQAQRPARLTVADRSRPRRHRVRNRGRRERRLCGDARTTAP